MTAFLQPARKAFPFRVTHVLKGRGSCFNTDDFERACAKIKVTNCTMRLYTPQTNGIVERFNGGIASEVMGIKVAEILISKSC